MRGFQYYLEKASIASIIQKGDNNFLSNVPVSICRTSADALTQDGVDMSSIYFALPRDIPLADIDRDIAQARASTTIVPGTPEAAMELLIHLLRQTAGYVLVNPPDEFEHEKILRPPYKKMDDAKKTYNCTEQLAFFCSNGDRAQ